MSKSVAYAYDSEKKLSAFAVPEELDIHNATELESFKQEVREELSIEKDSRVFILIGK